MCVLCEYSAQIFSMKNLKREKNNIIWDIFRNAENIPYYIIVEQLIYSFFFLDFL